MEANNQGIELVIYENELFMKEGDGLTMLEQIECHSRRIFRYKDKVIKLDARATNDWAEQGEREVEFYLNELDDCDKDYFLEPMGWGVATQVTWRKGTKNAEGEPLRPRFWIMQHYVDFTFPEGEEIPYGLSEIIEKYNLWDIDEDRNWAWDGEVPVIYDSFS